MDTETIISLLNHYVALGAVIGMVVLALYALLLVVSLYGKKNNRLLSFVAKYTLPLGFFITLIGMLMSLYYSEVLGIIPCVLCWYQRIFMYSQVFLFGYAWYKKDRNIIPYTFMLSIVGFVIAVYHHMLQIGYNIYKPCSTSPFAVDCAKPTFVEFGFVTFPFLAMVLFGAVILVILSANLVQKHKANK